MNRCKCLPPALVAIGSCLSIVEAQMPVARVVVGEAKVIEAQQSIALVGTVEPHRRSRVSSKISGIVADMPVRQGDFIPAHGMICKLEDTTRRFALAAEEAKLASLSAAHQELIAGTRPEELRLLKARLDEVVALYDRWKFEKQRIDKLFEGKDSNDKEYQDTRAEYLAAERRRVAAEAAYNLGLEGPRKEQIARAAYQVVEQQAVVDRLAHELEKTEIKAPFAGYIADRLTEVGEWIPEGGPVVEMLDLSSVLIRVNAPESALAYVKVGDTSRVMIDALGRSFDGTIRHVIRQAAKAARTFPVEIEIDNSETLLAGGMFARASIPSGPAQSVLAVPKDSLVERDGVTYLAVVVPGKEGGLLGILVPITAGIDVDDRITITSGNVQPGAQVITRGTERMLPFPSPIEIVDENGTPVALPASDKIKTPEAKAPEEGA